MPELPGSVCPLLPWNVPQHTYPSAIPRWGCVVPAYRDVRLPSGYHLDVLAATAGHRWHKIVIRRAEIRGIPMVVVDRPPVFLRIGRAERGSLGSRIAGPGRTMVEIAPLAPTGRGREEHRGQFADRNQFARTMVDGWRTGV